MRFHPLFLAPMAALVMAAAPVPITPAPVTPVPVTLPGGTQAIDVRVGYGAEAAPHHLALVHYSGWLYENGVRTKKFDSSLDRDQPFAFVLGEGDVIRGWDEGIQGMKVGGQRTLIVPPQAGYGDAGAGSDIPPGATLIFDVELLLVD